MQAVVGQKIWVRNPNEAVRGYCESELIVNNPEYETRVKLGKWTGGVRPTIQLYEEYKNDLVLPFGCLQDIAKLVEGKDLIPRFSQKRPVNYRSSIQLYPYQEEAVKSALRKRNGIIVMPCGAGKTQTALELVSRIGGTCLWLTHTHSLMQQSMSRAKACFGLPASAYGTITDGKVRIGSAITFATVQTMSRLDLPQYANQWDVVIVDECHRCIGSPTNVMMFYKVVSNLCSRFKFGLTATPHRADGLDKCMYALIGPKIHEVSRSEVKGTTCPVYVEWNKTGYNPDRKAILSSDGTIMYSKLIEAITKNDSRNRIIVDRIAQTDGPTLVMSDRIAHLISMREMLGDRKTSIIIDGSSYSKTAKASRDNALTRLNNGEIDVIFATYKLAKEGLDVPNLRYVVFASPQKDETTVTQSAGRVGRKAPGKKAGTVIDFSDNFGLMKTYENRRRRYYNKLNFTTIEVIG